MLVCLASQNTGRMVGVPPPHGPAGQEINPCGRLMRRAKALGEWLASLGKVGVLVMEDSFGVPSGRGRALVT